jgi:hypothetical protein
MEYLLMIFRSEAETHKASPEQTAQVTAAYGAYAEALGKAGLMRGGNRLRDVETATTVRVREGKTEVLNGPYAETREQLAGYFLIDAPDLDSALAWAARCPGASHGVMEVRPIWPLDSH